MDDLNHNDLLEEDAIDELMNRLSKIADIIDSHFGVPKELEDEDGSKMDV